MHLLQTDEHLKSLLNLNKYTWLMILVIFNPCPAEPGYTLPLQTV